MHIGWLGLAFILGAALTYRMALAGWLVGIHPDFSPERDPEPCPRVSNTLLRAAAMGLSQWRIMSAELRNRGQHALADEYERQAEIAEWQYLDHIKSTTGQGDQDGDVSDRDGANPRPERLGPV